jgi:hypothetical protein
MYTLFLLGFVGLEMVATIQASSDCHPHSNSQSLSFAPVYLYFTRDAVVGNSVSGNTACEQELQTIPNSVAQIMGLDYQYDINRVHVFAMQDHGNHSLLTAWHERNYNGPLINTQGHLIAPTIDSLFDCQAVATTPVPILTMNNEEPEQAWWWGGGNSPCLASACSCHNSSSCSGSGSGAGSGSSDLPTIPCGSINFYSHQTFNFQHDTMACFEQARYLCAVTVDGGRNSVSAICAF